MKFTSLMGAVVLVVTAGGALAQQSAKPSTPAPKLSTLSSGNEVGALPTEEEIKAFVSQYKESPTSKETLSLRVQVGVQKLPAAQRKKFESSKKVPYQLFVELIKTKEVNGKQTYTRTTNGKCGIAILDDTGKVVKQSSENLIKLCASWGGDGGLFGEVAKAGTYKVIVWMRKPKGVILGSVVETTLSL